MAENRRPFVRDAAVALAVYLVLLALTQLRYSPIAAPGHAIVLGFDAVQQQLAPGLRGGAYVVAVASYVLGLVALAGRVAGRLRGRFGAGGLRYGIVGAVIAVVAYAVAVTLGFLVSALPASWSPVAIATIVGLVGLRAGWRLGSRRSATPDGARVDR